jgi:N-acetylglucosaminyl-diphospho-decaprenol L-rhamnosyltransferase
MPDVDVAVVIVTYKSAQLTIDSLLAVAAERATPGLSIRAIVVDNDSGDLRAIGPAAEQNNWSSWVSLIAAPTNGGFAYGNNRGIEHAYRHSRPDYVYLLNPDAQVRPGAIGALVQFLETHPEVGIAGSSFEDFDGSDWPFAFRFPSLLSELSQGLGFGPVSRVLRRWEVPQRMTRMQQPIDWICGASMLIRPAVLAAIGGLDENYFLYYEETDFCLRAQRAGFATWYVPESRVMHIRGQSTQVTSSAKVPKRLPAYWFESRRRYFAMSYGVPRAVAIDLVAMLANIAGTLKRTLLGRTGSATPHLIADLARYSIIWPRNRHLPAVRCFLPSKSTDGQLSTPFHTD